MKKASIKGKEKALHALAEPNTDMIGSFEIVEKIPQRASVPHEIGESSKYPPTASKPSEIAARIAASKSTLPPELRLIIEAEQRAAAISCVESTLLPLTNGSNRQFLDFMRVYLRATIAQYMASGLTSTLGERDPKGSRRQEPNNSRRPSAISKTSPGPRWPKMDCDKQQSL
ncbi:EKA-like protein [Blumeria hordei DH14]|uniref:EKA-like protein n=1 Tax=Blumeria graminis f. sp. hordei (strain DH14) TaxID=546991 RepID=N1JPC2_BLUG1|nr:EKA-like protein [Blumeria hordei DH14]